MTFTHGVHVCLLVLGSVAGVAERLVAGAVLADEGPLACVAAVVDLEILQASEAARAAFHLKCSYSILIQGLVKGSLETLLICFISV